MPTRLASVVARNGGSGAAGRTGPWSTEATDCASFLTHEPREWLPIFRGDERAGEGARGAHGASGSGIMKIVWRRGRVSMASGDPRSWWPPPCAAPFGFFIRLIAGGCRSPKPGAIPLRLRHRWPRPNGDRTRGSTGQSSIPRARSVEQSYLDHQSHRPASVGAEEGLVGWRSLRSCSWVREPPRAGPPSTNVRDTHPTCF